MQRAVLAVAAATWASAAFGQTVSPVQSPARPFGLEPVAPVMLSGSDARAEAFNRDYLPNFRSIINDKLSESVEFTDRDGFKLDPTRLYLRTESDKPIRIYFLGEGAGYHNTLGYCLTTAGNEEIENPKLIFPDGSIGSKRTTWEPLQIGDFVEIGKGAGGMQLDFFLISDAVNGGKTTLTNRPDYNSDKLQHIVAFLLPNSPYILVGFEDIVGGGDLDYNDCLFVVDVGEVNAEFFDEDPIDFPH